MSKENIFALCEEVKQLYNECGVDITPKDLEVYYDATSLTVNDSQESVVGFTNHILKNYPNVATICVSPLFIDNVGLALGESNIGVTATVGGFPMGQTYIEVKLLECSMAIENGADEVDFVIDVAAVNAQDWEKAKCEIVEFIDEIDGLALSKAILECGALNDLETVGKASTLALEAGVDFIKTSTGKNCEGATLPAVIAMLLAIKDFYTQTGEKRGVKVAGGIKLIDDAKLYYCAVKHILGEEWLTPELFRIGTSSLVK